MYLPSSGLAAFISHLILKLKELQILITVVVGWIILISHLPRKEPTHQLCTVLRSILTPVTRILLTLSALHFPDLVKTLGVCLL